MSQLDATNIKARGERLIQEVVKIVGDSQAFILTPLPDSVLFTKEQLGTVTDYLLYASKYSQFTDTVTLTEDRLLQTKWNVMEIEVKG